MNLRAIDRLLGEHYMGYRYSEDGSRYEDVEEGEQRWYDTDFWRPSEAIADAWMLVESLGKMNEVDVGCAPTIPREEIWYCRVLPVDDTEHEGYYGQASTAPMAICLAALQAKGLEVPE